MGLFDKVNADFFQPLTSKHKELYVNISMQIEKIIASHGRMSVERDLLVELLEDYVISNELITDITDEEDYENIEPIRDRRSDRFYIGSVLLYLKYHQWIQIDQNVLQKEKSVSLTYYARVFLSFVKDIVNEREQIGYIVRIYASLSSVNEENMVDSYQNLLNANDDFDELIKTLGQADAKIKDYYDIQLKKVAVDQNQKSSILAQYFDEYYEQVIERYLFPTLVNDSLKRYEVRIRNLLHELILNEDMKQVILESAVTHRRIPVDRISTNTIESMLYDMLNKVNAIKDQTMILVEHDNQLRRIIKEKIRNLLQTDLSLHGILLELFQVIDEDEDFVVHQANKNLQYDRVEYIESSSVMRILDSSERKKREAASFVNESDSIQEEDLNDFDRFKQFSKKEVEGYYLNMMGTAKSKSIREFPMEHDEDYVKSILLYVNSLDNEKQVDVDVLKDQVKKDPYEVPEMIVRRSEAYDD